MTIIVALSLIAELSCFMLYDIFRNRSNAPERRLIRLIAGSTGIVSILLDVLLSRPCEPRHLLLDIMFATEILMLLPCSFEKPSLAIKAAISVNLGGMLILMAFMLVPPGHGVFRYHRIIWSYFLVLSSFFLYFGVVAAKRFKGIRLFFRNAAVWHNVEDYSRFLYAMAFLCVGAYSLCSMAIPGDFGTMAIVGATVMSMVLYAVLYLRALTGRTFVLNIATEERIKDIIKGNLRTSFIDKAEEDRKMNNLYRKVMFFMSEKKPYLDPDFCMDNLAERMYSNKLYLSRTINILSGRNFRQFINYHRIQYAMALFRKDPRLKVSEVSEMSGFNSAVSFNMAFKVNTGKTPSEWLQEHVVETKERL